MQQDRSREKQGWERRGHAGNRWGCLGSAPEGTACPSVGKPIALLRCTGQQPAPLWTSLPCRALGRDPLCRTCAPSLSCSMGGGSPRSPQDALGPGPPLFGFWFLFGCQSMESCWGEEGEIGPRFPVASSQISLHKLKEWTHCDIGYCCSSKNVFGNGTSLLNWKNAHICISRH